MKNKWNWKKSKILCLWFKKLLFEINYILLNIHKKINRNKYFIRKNKIFIQLILIKIKENIIKKKQKIRDKSLIEKKYLKKPNENTLYFKE